MRIDGQRRQPLSHGDIPDVGAERAFVDRQVVIEGSRIAGITPFGR